MRGAITGAISGGALGVVVLTLGFSLEDWQYWTVVLTGLFAYMMGRLT